MPQHAKSLPCKPDTLSSVLRTHITVKRINFPKLSSSPEALWCDCTPPTLQIPNKIITETKRKSETKIGNVFICSLEK